MSDRATIKEIEIAIKIATYGIRRHDMPEFLPALKRFEAYLEQRQAEICAALSAARNSIEKYLDGDKLAGGAA